MAEPSREVLEKQMETEFEKEWDTFMKEEWNPTLKRHEE